MSTRYSSGRILQAGIGLALVGALAVAGGCAAPAGESEAQQAEVVNPPVGPVGPVEPGFSSGIYRCNSGSSGPSTLVVNDNQTCFIIHGVVAPGATPTFCIGRVCAACWSIARNTIGCNLQ